MEAAPRPGPHRKSKPTSPCMNGTQMLSGNRAPVTGPTPVQLRPAPRTLENGLARGRRHAPASQLIRPRVQGASPDAPKPHAAPQNPREDAPQPVRCCALPPIGFFS